MSAPKDPADAFKQRVPVDMAPDPQDQEAGQEGGGESDAELDQRELNNELAWLPRNDDGNARRLLRRHGRDLIYVQNKGFHTWDGKRFRHDVGDAGGYGPLSMSLARDMARSIFDEAEALKPMVEMTTVSKEFQSSVKKWANTSGNFGKVKAALDFVAVDPANCTAVNEMDSDPYLLTVDNGTLTLPNHHDGEVTIEPANRDHRISRLVPVAYRPGATCPNFEAFLERVQPNPDMRSFLQRWFGYNLSGLTNSQKMVVFFGQGANGKSTLVETLAKILGDYAASTPIATFLADDKKDASKASPDLARLPGVRCLTAAEPSMGDRLNETFIKTVTGGETVQARKLYKDMFDYTPAFKLTLSCNQRPRIRGQDEGIWRRILLVPFGVQIPPNERDPALMDTLAQEAEGILNWLIDGYMGWLNQGLAEPEEVRKATSEYRSDMDPLGSFLEECAEVNPGSDDMVKASVLVEAYEWWAEYNAAPSMTATALGLAWPNKGLSKKPQSDGHYWVGLKLKQAEVNRIQMEVATRRSSRVERD